MGFALLLERGILLKSRIELMLVEGVEVGMEDRFQPTAPPMVNSLTDLSM